VLNSGATLIGWIHEAIVDTIVDTTIASCIVCLHAYHTAGVQRLDLCMAMTTIQNILRNNLRTNEQMNLKIYNLRAIREQTRHADLLACIVSLMLDLVSWRISRITQLIAYCLRQYHIVSSHLRASRRLQLAKIYSHADTEMSYRRHEPAVSDQQPPGSDTLASASDYNAIIVGALHGYIIATVKYIYIHFISPNEW